MLGPDQQQAEQLATAMSECLDCEDDPELMEAEAECAEQEMDLHNQQEGTDCMMELDGSEVEKRPGLGTVLD